MHAHVWRNYVRMQVDIYVQPPKDGNQNDQMSRFCTLTCPFGSLDSPSIYWGTTRYVPSTKGMLCRMNPSRSFNPMHFYSILLIPRNSNPYWILFILPQKMVMPWNHQPLDEAIGDGHHGDVFWDDGEFVAIRGHRGDDDGGVARTSSGIPGRLQGWVCGVLVMPWRFCGSLIVWLGMKHGET